jgi:hypothetical protein
MIAATVLIIAAAARFDRGTSHFAQRSAVSRFVPHLCAGLASAGTHSNLGIVQNVFGSTGAE